MKIGTQNQHFFPAKIEDKFCYLRDAGFDGFEIDGRILATHFSEVKKAISKTGIPVTSACGGYEGWIGDLSEDRRLNALSQIKEILHLLGEVGGLGIVIPAAWGMASYRLPPMIPRRTPAEDWEVVSDSLFVLEKAAADTGTCILLEPLNRYQDHMINTLAQARQYIEENDLLSVSIVADLYHMNIEEDNILSSLGEHHKLIKHIHLADNQRYQPGTGSLNFREVFDQLKRDNYDGFLTLECRVRGDNPQIEYQKSLAFLRDASN